MNFEIINGWVEGVNRCYSPNFNQRPDACDISLLVIHSISLPPGQYGNAYIDNLFCNVLETSAHPYFKEIEGLEVSAHFLISRDGTVTQYVSTLNRAWHAGNSNFQGRNNCNDFSIGIELEGLEGELFEQEQYRVLAKLCCCLMKNYPEINQDRICGHSDISPGRKQDPGSGFDWHYFFCCLDEDLLNKLLV